MYSETKRGKHSQASLPLFNPKHLFFETIFLNTPLRHMFDKVQ